MELVILGVVLAVNVATLVRLEQLGRRRRYRLTRAEKSKTQNEGGVK